MDPLRPDPEDDDYILAKALLVLGVLVIFWTMRCTVC